MAALKFIADAHLGKLTRYLRLLGFDTIFDSSLSDEKIIFLSRSENRLILTRDRGILNKMGIPKAYFVDSASVKDQLRDLNKKINLIDQIEPFTRCLNCNCRIEVMNKNDVPESIKIMVKAGHDTFTKCPQCQKIYWQGSHYARMSKFIQSLLSSD